MFPPFPQVTEMSWKPVVLQNESEFGRSTMTEPFPLRSSGPKVRYFHKTITKTHAFFFFTFHNPSWEKTGTSIWGMEGSTGGLLVIKQKVTRPCLWWLIFTFNQLDSLSINLIGLRNPRRAHISMCQWGWLQGNLPKEGSTIHGLGFQLEWKGKIQLSTSMYRSLLPGCGCQVTTASSSYSFAFPAMVNFIFRLWAQRDPSFSYFCQVSCHIKKRKATDITVISYL